MRVRLFGSMFVIVALVIGVSAASARVVRSAKNTTWEKATDVTLGQEPTQLFGVLGTTGDARFFVFEVNDIGRLSVSLDVPSWAEKKFVPHIVLYQPDTVTAGPIIPVLQPPKTIALVYPPTVPKTRTDQTAWLSVTERLTADLELPVTGTYYLAVYNAGQLGGRWRLTMMSDDDQTFSAWSWPKRWWITQHWGNQYAIMTYVPLFALALAMILIWVLTQKKHQPVHRKEKV